MQQTCSNSQLVPEIIKSLLSKGPLKKLTPSHLLQGDSHTDSWRDLDWKILFLIIGDCYGY